VIRAWTFTEKQIIREAANNVALGASIYSEVKRLREGELKGRSWESIRSQINRTRRKVAV